ncbi:MAG TPA: hypothetical protein PK977_00250, partial [Chitinophagaceae bacterium]|nr:hypothetical protein [Chitinophagaceae bacterium]
DGLFLNLLYPNKTLLLTEGNCRSKGGSSPIKVIRFAGSFIPSKDSRGLARVKEVELFNPTTQPASLIESVYPD